MVIVPSSRAGTAVAELEDVGHGVLRQPPHPRREEEDHRDPDPRAGRLPQRRQPDPVAEPGAGEQAARADPGRQQREDQHPRRQRPAGDQEVVAAARARARPPHAHHRERDEVDEDRGQVEPHRAVTLACSSRGSRFAVRGFASAVRAQRARRRRDRLIANRSRDCPERDARDRADCGPRDRGPRLCSYLMAIPADGGARAARPRVLRASARAVHALLHRDVGALQLLRHAGAALLFMTAPLAAGGLGFDTATARRDLRPLHLDGLHDHAAGRLDRRPPDRPAPRRALRRHPDRLRPLQHGVARR